MSMTNYQIVYRPEIRCFVVREGGHAAHFGQFRTSAGARKAIRRDEADLDFVEGIDFTITVTEKDVLA